MIPSSETSYPAVGETIDGKYRVDRYVGEGGMGAVALATHVIRKAPVALKFMAPHIAVVPGAVDRFVNEAVAASQLRSEHIVQVFDVGTLPDGAPYIVLEYLKGRDAAAMLEADGPQGIDPARAAHVTLQVLRALEVAHAAGIIHRDLKPSNCFLVKHEGDPEFVKLLDFGISKVTGVANASLTQTNAALGTPLYMSPEQARSSRDVDARTDVYSTGVILYELLSGRPPHMVDTGELTAILYKLFTTDAPPLAEARPGLPAGLYAVVHKALARDITARFQSAHDFAVALVPYCDERSAIEIAHMRAVGGSIPPPSATEPALQQTAPIDPRGQDAVAATQIGSSPPPGSSFPPAYRPATSPAVSVAPRAQDGARTDLSSTRDQQPSQPSAPASSAPAKRWRTPAIVVGALGAVAIVGVALKMGHANNTPTAVPSEVTHATPSAPPPASVAAPPAPPSASVSASAAPSASAAHTTTPTTATAVKQHGGGLNGIQPVE